MVAELRRSPQGRQGIFAHIKRQHPLNEFQGGAARCYDLNGLRPKYIVVMAIVKRSLALRLQLPREPGFRNRRPDLNLVEHLSFPDSHKRTTGRLESFP